MRLTFFFLTLCFLQVSANGVSQNIHFSGREVPLQKVFAAIEQQTGFLVVYNYDQLEKAKLVSIEANNMQLSSFLEKIFKEQPFRFLIRDRTIVLELKEETAAASWYASPPQKITGRVTDETGKVLKGATVSIKGSRNSVSTNEQGNFELNAEKDEVLIISYIGFLTQEIKISSNAALNIVLKLQVNELAGTVVTAYGMERRTKELGYSVAKVSGEEINRANSGNLLTGLIGKVSGVSITTQSSDMTPQMRILIRGIRSFGQNSNNQPLFIFNGSPLSFGADQASAQLVMDFINNINPADIEDVTILKGANGTAIYGPEGVNGVIIITTKKGVKGKTSINFRSNNSFQIVDYRRDRRQRLFGLGSAPDQFGNRSTYSWGPKYDGSMVPIGYPDADGNVQMVPYQDTKEAHRFFNTAKTNRNNLSFSQSDNNSSFYLGLGYTAQTGLLPGDKQNQATILMNSSRSFGKINVQLNFNYARTTSDRGPDLQDAIRGLPSFIPITRYKDFVNDHWSQPDNYWNGISPYQQLATNRNKGTTNAVAGNIILNIKVLPWLTIKEQPGINYSGIYSKGTIEPINYSDFAAQDPAKAYDRFASVNERMETNTSLNNDLLLSTIHQAGPFLIRVNAGNTIRENYSKLMKAGSELVVPVYNLAFYSYLTPAQESAILSRTYSFFGNTLVGYKDRVFLEFTARNEWDSKRAQVARGKDLYMGANASLVMTDIIPSLKKFKWLTMSRLRASLAHSANMNISPYQSDRLLVLSGGYPFVNNTTGDYLLSYQFYADNNPNPLLKPEKVISQEYGANFNFLNNRIILDAAYYYQRNNSVILLVQNAWLSGYPNTDNAGDFENRGWEFDLNINPLFRLPNKMSVSLQGRFAINDNKVLGLTPVYKDLFPARDPSGQVYYARTNHSAFEFSVRDWKRDPEGRVIVDKTTGLPIPQGYDEFMLKGKTLPKYLASFSLNFSWKNLTMTVQGDYSGGNQHLFDPWGDLYMGTHSLTVLNNREKYVFPNSVYNDGSGKFVENKDVAVSSTGQQLYQNFATVNMHGLTNAAFWKIRELAIQYDWPLKTNWVKMISLSVYGRDLFSFYPKSNINGDPGLIKGPGQRNFELVNNNLSGGSSEPSALPGTVLFGFTTAVTF